MDHYLNTASTQTSFNEDESVFKQQKPSLGERDITDSSANFECNICLDAVQDPVVTLCGHLYCWPCIYKWISSRNISQEDTVYQDPQCPVCKNDISEETLIPLYSQGQTTNKRSSKNELSSLDYLIPQRPASQNSTILRNAVDYTSRARTSGSYNEPYRTHDHGLDSYTASCPLFGIEASTSRLVVDPMIGMFGEMVYARMFGNSDTTLYTYPDSYNLVDNSSPRLRRWLKEADRSLGRVCFFLFCCMLMCLLLF